LKKTSGSRNVQVQFGQSKT